MNDNIFISLIKNQKLTKNQKKKVYSLFSTHLTLFSDFLANIVDEYGDNEEVFKKYNIQFANDKFWNEVLKNYNKDDNYYNSSYVGEKILDRLYYGYEFDKDLSFFDVLNDSIRYYSSELGYTAEGFYETFERWIKQGKIFNDMDEDDIVRLIVENKGADNAYVGETIFYLCTNAGILSEKAIKKADSYLDYTITNYEEVEQEDGTIEEEGIEEPISFIDYVYELYGDYKYFLQS